MGYFSNATEGELYMEDFCHRCLFNAKCPILAIHMTYNYEQHKDSEVKNILSSFIPRSKDGLSNEKCKMFIRR